MGIPTSVNSGMALMQCKNQAVSQGRLPLCLERRHPQSSVQQCLLSHVAHHQYPKNALRRMRTFFDSLDKTKSSFPLQFFFSDRIRSTQVEKAHQYSLLDDQQHGLLENEVAICHSQTLKETFSIAFVRTLGSRISLVQPTKCSQATEAHQSKRTNFDCQVYLKQFFGTSRGCQLQEMAHSSCTFLTTVKSLSRYYATGKNVLLCLATTPDLGLHARPANNFSLKISLPMSLSLSGEH